MNYYHAQVKLKKRGADNQVTKHNITAAEIAVLRRIHGDDAVINIWPIPAEKEDRTPHEDILDELIRKYDKKGATPDQTVNVREILACPAGRKANLPLTIDELSEIEDFVTDNELFYAGEEEKEAARKARLAAQEEKVANKPKAKGKAQLVAA